MIHSEKGKVIMNVSTNPKLAEAEAYSDLACIFDAIQHEFGLSVLLTYLEFYTTKEINTDGSRN